MRRLRRPAPAQKTVVDQVRAFYEEHPRGVAGAPRSRAYFHQYLARVLRARIPAGQRVLDIGCGGGEMLAALQPSRGVGVDLSATVVTAAETRRTCSSAIIRCWRAW